MTELLNIFGAPGTGKTRKLTEIALLCAQRYGPKRIAAVTYTKPAAIELQRRIGEALGMSPLTDEKYLAREMPYIGTIHAVSWHLRGAPPVMSHNHFREFCTEVSIQPPPPGYSARPDDVEAFWFAGVGREEGAIFRSVLSYARHTQQDIADCMDRIPYGSWHITAERLELVATEYARWKRDRRLIDYEDMLDLGLTAQPPVEVLICDEAQDNSRHMWAVLDHWLPRTQLFITGGDAGQSIFAFNGADPLLFASRPGNWQMLDPSHRLSAQAAEYAKAVLAVGWEDPRFQGWTGIGGQAVDGTTFYLARTGRLQGIVEEDLERAGEPYIHFPGRGMSPWQTHAAEAYRTLVRLERGEPVPTDELRVVAKEIPTGLLTADQRQHIRGLNQGVDGEYAEAAAAVRMFGPLDKAKLKLKYAPYLGAIERRYGYRGLVLTPTTTVGTIHAAKGKEADVVHLVSSWATLPARSLQEEEGARAEACVAYVAVSRHRTQLNFIQIPEGTDYPWPGR